MKTKNVAWVAVTVALLASHKVTHAGVCDYADRAFAKVTTVIAGTWLAAGAALKAAGVSAVAHSSGAAIVSTASGGYYPEKTPGSAGVTVAV